MGFIMSNWSSWGTTPFAYRTIIGDVFGIHFKIEFSTQAYRDNTDKFHSLFCAKDLNALQAHYDKYKDLYRGSVEWEAGLPVWLHRLRVLSK